MGEVAIRSPFTLDRYLDNPEATAAAIGADGWYHSGDLGFLSGGQLFITGRRKDLIIVGGRNFYPQDLEASQDQYAMTTYTLFNPTHVPDGGTTASLLGASLLALGGVRRFIRRRVA